MDWFYLYFIGFLVLIAAVAMGTNMIGIVMSAVKHTRGMSEGDGQ